MENRVQSSSAGSSFMKGFMNSAGSGALMSGIFYGLAIGLFKFTSINMLHLAAGTSIIGAIGTVMPVALLMVAAVGVFGGIMAVKRAADEAKEAPGHAASHAGHTRETTPVIVPMVGAAVAADRAEAPESSWADRTGGSRNSRIQEILANGRLSDGDRASAILAERDAAASAASQR